MRPPQSQSALSFDKRNFPGSNTAAAIRILALSPDEKTLYSANAISDSVAVFDLQNLAAGQSVQASGFIPTDWYPTVVATTSKDLLIASAKGRRVRPQLESTKKGPYWPSRLPLHSRADQRLVISFRAGRPARRSSCLHRQVHRDERSSRQW